MENLGKAIVQGCSGREEDQRQRGAQLQPRTEISGACISIETLEMERIDKFLRKYDDLVVVRTEQEEGIKKEYMTCQRPHSKLLRVWIKSTVLQGVSHLVSVFFGKGQCIFLHWKGNGKWKNEVNPPQLLSSTLSKDRVVITQHRKTSLSFSS